MQRNCRFLINEEDLENCNIERTIFRLSVMKEIGRKDSNFI